MGADPARAGARAALARGCGAPPSVALERTSDARAESPTCALPQVLRVVRSGLGRAERGSAAGERSSARGARRHRPASAVVLPGPARGNTEARAARREARGL